MTLREQLCRDEGVRLKPYRDSVGLLTIGVGHNLEAHGISQAVCDLLLTEDIADVEAGVRARLPWATPARLGEARHAVLLNMSFNLGLGGLLGFKRFLADVEAGEWTMAATEMMNSKWAQQVGARADRLARQMETDTWQ
jgi:lysozyme